MPNSNVGKRVIRAAGRDGCTWVTYRHPERARVAVWIGQGDVDPTEKYASRDAGENWNRDPTGKGLPAIPGVGDVNCKKPGFGLIKPSLSETRK